jgi:hypothetical protein
MTTSNSPQPARTARQWQLAHGRAAVNWVHSSGIAQRMLTDICTAVETTVDWLIAGSSQRAQWVIRQYPQVLTSCDVLQFNDPAQALAYLILHLPDRYCRMFQVLERLLLSGRLPLGRRREFAPVDDFAAIDIGAGPGPAIFAIRSFYAALAHYAALHDAPGSIAALGRATIVERSRGMPYIMHRFAEALTMGERGYGVQGWPTGPIADLPAHPLAAELDRSARPHGADHDDFAALDVREEHNRARAKAERWYAADDDLAPSEAHWYAYNGPASMPSSYALVVMMNFLTTTNAIPAFTDAIERLMRRSLVPGGTILVLGAVGNKYREIYPELDRRAQAARLQVLPGFEDSLQAGQRPDELASTCTLTRSVWNKLEELAGDVAQTKDELRTLGAADIFDASMPFQLPRFRVRAYRRGR